MNHNGDICTATVEDDDDDYEEIENFQLWSTFKGRSMSRPHGVKVGPTGDILVADRNNGLVKVFTLHGRYVNKITVSEDPIDMAVLEEDVIAISDHKKKTVLVCTKGSQVLREIGMGLLVAPLGIASKHKLLYVADSGDSNIKVFTFSGEHVRTIGSVGKGQGELLVPWFIAINKKDQVIVADALNNAVKVYTLEGEFLFQFGKFGTREGQLINPRGVAVDKKNNIFVTSNHMIQMFDQKGEFLSRVDLPKDGMKSPHGIVVATYEPIEIAVADTGNNCIKVYAKEDEQDRLQEDEVDSLPSLAQMEPRRNSTIASLPLDFHHKPLLKRRSSVFF
uniref:Tripartite motif-containing protein 2-like n=1 Tax=Saccoglossus kowalevskii TaxID=10224 RepID=A0ABM0MT46_SACKO|nr:PREDICTED: tripartite motif-containing protein 2-like [Saccoglossus kowalevskii]